MTPVYLTSTYAQRGPGVHKGFEYSRTHNPTRFALEANLAALEGGPTGLAFASGLAATDACSTCSRRATTWSPPTTSTAAPSACSTRSSGGTGSTFEPVDMTDPRHVDAGAAAPTELVWIETPTNPMLKIVDLAAVAALARPAGRARCRQHLRHAVLPAAARLGADIVVHSMTKYLNGHSDVVGGGRGHDRSRRSPSGSASCRTRSARVPSPMDSLPGAARA